MKRNVKKIFDMFKGLPDHELRMIEKSGEIIEVQQGRFLQIEGEGCSGVPMIISGRIRFYKNTDEGKERTLFRLSKGEICLLAALCLLGEMNYSFNAIAEENSAILLIPAPLFFQLYHSDHNIQKYIFGQMAGKLIYAYEQVESASLFDVKTRIKNYLIDHCDENQNVFVTHEIIARDIGTSREVVTRKLKMLKDEGKIALGRGRITLFRG
ncbi:MAG: Crp/Fnr family transcriptional regulator [Eubacteriaceae bacterium]|nr:Crp/Fnr family transcriptional regulator [Eubacteriaceae bacterium]